MIRTLLTENGVEWRMFDYAFEQVVEAQSTLEKILTDIRQTCRRW